MFNYPFKIVGYYLFIKNMNKKIAIGGPNPLSDEIKSKPSTKIKQQEEYH